MIYQKDSTMFKEKNLINISGYTLDLSKPLVMGILNITPDSFYDGGKYSANEDIIKRADEILSEGGDIIDIGGFSTRPGSSFITEDEEITRILPAAKLVRETFPHAIISIDTFRTSIIDAIFKSIGPVIINDISGGDFDNKMFETVRRYQLPYIMMHMQGTIENMQINPFYNDISVDIIKHFSKKVEILKSLGVKDIILDPGFGFGKTLKQNYELLNKLDDFKILELPILIGISRKSMIYKALGISPEEALPGTMLLHGFALERGAKILRVHDVKEACDSIKIFEKLTKFSKS